ncbi:TonB-linked outer membrane protein, SusC/RagA family [Mariniphaga anaerophila]|uniref:TonB-linked outer membrane protein, SusC/RagA family n=1 Tax=Mariniphaga anaerophila TaxID=1484053 RepID=A0A1M5FLH1_9BACT|nr:TonB-dependent receptor [Mariniphaga anaerophila]SHF92274.1 TonB-linked outer membrane protein, SusC/RagA family [Mariniphaga anaerophila]
MKKLKTLRRGLSKALNSLFTISFLLILLCTSTIAFSQVNVEGTILDETDTPLPGVSVFIKGTTNGTVTSTSGNFSLNADENDVVIMSFVGYTTEEITVTLGMQKLAISMKPDFIGLDEVVAIGYGTQKKGDVTSSIASVKEKDFTQGVMSDAGGLIKGKVAGLTINNSSGAPGSGSEIILRGTSSILGSSSPLVLVNGIPGDLNVIAPDDIASFDVLKDASASAIYGTRGANGVILITTKKAKGDGKATITYSGYASVSQFQKKADFLDAWDYKVLGGIGEDLPYPDRRHDTNWLDEITRTPFTQNHNIALRGGTQKFQYSVTANYSEENGMFESSTNEEQKYTVDLSQKMFDDKLTVNFNLIKGLTSGVGFNSYIYRQALIRNPTEPIYDENGDYYDPNIFQYLNPVGMLKEKTEGGEGEWTWVTGGLTLNPVKGLFLKGTATTKRWSSQNGYYENSTYPIATHNGYASRGASYSKTNLLDLTSTYSANIEKHRISGVVGYNYEDNLSEGFNANNAGFPTDVYTYNNLGEGTFLKEGKAGMSSYKNSSKLIAFLGRVSYGFDDRFNLLASLRYEGSSKFGVNNKWGAFPSVSLGWNLHKESFMQDASMVNNLKLRLGYGVTGITPNSSYQSLTLYNYSGYFNDNGRWVPGLTPSSNPNPDLRWERTTEYNLGIDFGLWDGVLSGSIDVYDRLTADLLYNYQVPTPPYLFGSLLTNVGDMSNKGIEVALNSNIINKTNFKWTTSLNFSYNKNELTRISNEKFEVKDNRFFAGYTGDPIQNSTHIVEEGQPIGNMWTWKTVDIGRNGEWIIETPEGEQKYISEATEDDKMVLGNGVPNYTMGWVNNVQYKNFDLNFVFTGAFDYQIINFQRMFYENPTITYNMLSSAFDKVYGKTRLDYTQEYLSYYIEDGDYVKLQNVTLGYNFNVSSVDFIQSARIYVAGNNLFTITKYKGMDPEVNRTGLTPGTDNRDKYPTVRTFTFGLNFTF